MHRFPVLAREATNCLCRPFLLLSRLDHVDDAEPWPLFIEDFNGKTHEVYLTPGDMIVYESSKLHHGRPRKFSGSWYSNVIGHYHPADAQWSERDHQLEAHYAVPPRWINDDLLPDDDDDDKTDDTGEGETPVRHRLKVGGGMTEPDCPDGWCRAVDSVKWNGPATEGYVTHPDGSKAPFHPNKAHEEDDVDDEL